MGWKEVLKEANDKATPLELIGEILQCLDSLYSEDVGNGLKKLPKGLSDYAGFIHVAHKEAQLLKSKLEGTPDIKKIVQISFAGNQERLYDYFTDMGDLQNGDWVVCHTLQGYGLGRVVRHIETSTKAEKWLVQRVDVEGHKAKLERERRAREIEDMLG